MGKRTHRRTPNTAQKHNYKCISRKDCRLAVRARLAAGREGRCRQEPACDRLREVLQEGALECPICLQTLLWPVLSECGHLFCLPCAEQLSRHDYACGMCRNFEPTYEPRVDRRFQELVRSFLVKGPSEERLIFQQRQKALQEGEKRRGTGTVAVGDQVDFWSIDEKCWLSGSVRDITDDGQLMLCEPKGLKIILLDADSRRLARHRHFTKEQPVREERVEMDPFEGTRSMFGMPMYINFFGGGEASSGGFNMDINELLGLIPSFRPFPF